jgi:hypothetical protein
MDLDGDEFDFDLVAGMRRGLEDNVLDLIDDENEDMTLEGHLELMAKDENEAYHGEMDFKDKLNLASQTPVKLFRPAMQQVDIQKKAMLNKPRPEIQPALPVVCKENLEEIMRKTTPPIDQMTKSKLAACVKLH